MYHPTRGGVRGGRDQLTWEDVKVDKHRENYLGHSIKAPVGRWQKGKDLNWYARDKKSIELEMQAAKEEIQRIKEQEEQAMREALGLAPTHLSWPQGNRLDKHEFAELVRRGTTAEDLGGGHAEAARVQGLGFSSCRSLKAISFHVDVIDFSLYFRAARNWEGESSSVCEDAEEAAFIESVNGAASKPTSRSPEKEASEDESRKKRRREERKQEKTEKQSSHDSDNKRKHEREKSRRHDSD
ncbi:uncharacterized protein [Aristolochia californica]|uniref:uncharacterized protein n=1 Tax=Aristolochia californica TaxID=171875 RepID=UPI0035E1BB2F